MTISKAWAIDDEVIGSYRILRLLGRGGMGEVYLAWTGLRLVAVKVLSPQHASDAVFSQMFLNEARMAARLTHSGIAQVLDVGTDSGRLFMVMEYVAGHTLDELLRDPAIPGMMPLRIAVSTFAYVAHALATAHRAGIIHRDISPHNLLVSDTGAMKIIDFGIARADSGDVHTSPGTFRGRFGYMAPEYVQGLPCDHRVDLFALGVVMWETFARQRLYAGTAAAQLFAMVERPAERLDALIDGFPIELADIVARLLEREPAMRYSKGDEVASDLERLMPALGDDGFRNLEHWVAHHLSARIEARGKTDREALQRVAGEDAAGRLAAEVATSTLDGERTASEGFVLSNDSESTAVEVPRLRHAGGWSGIPNGLASGAGSGGIASGAGSGGIASGDEVSIILESGGGTLAGVAPMAVPHGQGAAHGSGYGALPPGAQPGAQDARRDNALVRLMGDQRRGLLLVAALSAIVVILSLWLGLRGEMRARAAQRQVEESAVRGERKRAEQPDGGGGEERAAPTERDHGTGSTGKAPSAPGSTGEAPGVAGEEPKAIGTPDAMAEPARDGGGDQGGDQGEVDELELEDTVPQAAPEANERTGRARPSRREKSSRREEEAKPPAPVPVAPLAPELKTPPLVMPPAPPPAPAPKQPAASSTGSVLASAGKPTPRVPSDMMGDETRGAAIVVQCNACHVQMKKKSVTGKMKTVTQWERFFGGGTHDRWLPLGGVMGVNELAAAKAYLLPRAVDATTRDEGAGVR